MHPHNHGALLGHSQRQKPCLHPIQWRIRLRTHRARRPNTRAPIRSNEKQNQTGIARILHSHVYKEATPQDRVTVNFIATVVAQNPNDATSTLNCLGLQNDVKQSQLLKAYGELSVIIVASQHCYSVPQNLVERKIIMSQTPEGQTLETRSIFFSHDTNPHGPASQSIDIAFLFNTCTDENRRLLCAALECATNTCICKQADKAHNHIIVNGQRPEVDPQHILDVDVDVNLHDIFPIAPEDSVDSIRAVRKTLGAIEKNIGREAELYTIKIDAQRIQIETLEATIKESESEKEALQERLRESEAQRVALEKQLDQQHAKTREMHKSFTEWMGSISRPQGKRKNTIDHTGRTSPAP